MALNSVVPEQSLTWPDEWPEAMGSLCLEFQCALPIFMVHTSLHTEKLGKGTKCHTKAGFLSVHSSQPFLSIVQKKSLEALQGLCMETWLCSHSAPEASSLSFQPSPADFVCLVWVSPGTSIHAFPLGFRLLWVGLSTLSPFKLLLSESLSSRWS